MRQIFTFTAKIDPDRIHELRDYLRALEQQAGGHPDLPFREMERLHFASLVIVDDPSGVFDPYVVFENNIDGTIAAHIEQLCEIAHAGLHTIYSMCRDYGAGAYDRGRMRAYLRGHLLLPNASFVGNVGRTVGRIKADRALVDEIEQHLDQIVARPEFELTRPAPGSPGLVAKKATLVYTKLRAHVGSRQSWALAPRGRLSSGELVRRWLAFAAIAGPAYLLWPITVPLLVVFLWVLRLHEQFDSSDIGSLAPDRVVAASAREDQRLQNHFASVNVVKPGLFRRTTLRVVLLLVDRAAALCVHGKLSGLTNIHFAHWVLLDGGRRLLFLTNYDGSWENYLDDFIDRASPGLTAIWSNVKNFPRTRFLLFGGARDERNFKKIARKSQLETNVWYSAYPSLAVPSIDNNSDIRDGIATPPLAKQAVHQWLQRL